MKVTKRNVGQRVIFHAFDGNDYPAKITQKRNGMVCIQYGVNGLPVLAYLDRDECASHLSE